MDPLAPSRHRSPDAPASGDEPISVAALLRREGRGRHAVDRPLLPRGHSREVPPPPRRSLRKAGAAAGALFAVGVVFGGAVLDESGIRPGGEPEPGARGDGPAPGGLAPDGTTGTGGADVVALAAQGSGPAPDPGDDVPTASGPGIAGDALAAGSGGTGSGLPAVVGLPTPADRPSFAGPGGAGTPAGQIPVGAAPVGQAPGGDSGGDDSGGGSPGTRVPGSGVPGGGDPGSGTRGGDSGGADSPGPGPRATVALPDLATPAVEVPGVTRPDSPVATPRIAVSEATLDAPDLTLGTGDDGLALSASHAAVTTPDVRASAVDAGPVGLTDSAVELPDVGLRAAAPAPLLAVGPDPVPEPTVSSAALATRDVRLGGTEVEVPDLRTPGPAVPEVPVVETVTSAVGSLLTFDHGSNARLVGSGGPGVPGMA